MQGLDDRGTTAPSLIVLLADGHDALIHGRRQVLAARRLRAAQIVVDAGAVGVEDGEVEGGDVGHIHGALLPRPVADRVVLVLSDLHRSDHLYLVAHVRLRIGSLDGGTREYSLLCRADRALADERVLDALERLEPRLLVCLVHDRRGALDRVEDARLIAVQLRFEEARVVDIQRRGERVLVRIDALIMQLPI